MEPAHRKPLSILSGISTFLFLISLCACTGKNKLVEIDPAFSKYIDAYTSGTVSRKNMVRIQLAAESSTTHAVNDIVKETLFEFSPAVAGKAYWTDSRTIEFRPDKDLNAGQLY